MKRTIPLLKIGIVLFIVEKTGVIGYLTNLLLVLKNKTINGKGVKIDINENFPFELYSTECNAEDLSTGKLKIKIPKKVAKIIKFVSEYKLISKIINNIPKQNRTDDQSDQMDKKLVSDILKEVERISRNRD